MMHICINTCQGVNFSSCFFSFKMRFILKIAMEKIKRKRGVLCFFLINFGFLF